MKGLHKIPSLTEIIVSDTFIPINERGIEWERKATCAQVRDIFLRRKSKKWVSLSDVEDVSRSFPTKIVDESGNIILKLEKEDYLKKTKTWQIFKGLHLVLKMMHSEYYKKTDCAYFFELMQWIDNSYHKWWRVNDKKYDIFLIPPFLLKEQKVEFEVWDTILSTKEIEIDKTQISDTLQVTDKDFSYKWFHFATYIGNGFFISKYWRNHKFCIWTLEEIMRDYGTRHLFCLQPKEWVNSKYDNF